MSEPVDLVPLFTTTEVIGAGSMSISTLDLLVREGLTPPPVLPARRSRPARYSFAALSQVTVTRTLTKTTESPVVAARMSGAIVRALRDQGKPFIPFGFEDLQHKLASRPDKLAMARNPDGEFCPYRTIEAAWRTGLLDEQEPARCDYMLVIVDGELIGEAYRGLSLLMQNPKSDTGVWPVLSYRYGGKSKGLEVRELRSEADEAMFCERVRRAETLVQINLSLALRRTVVEIIRTREAS
ncbi:hypothetical protein D1122_04575 [Cereibacter sphaeroides]|uniref:hypothetical protein n=1 Tax=Cereibacter sphaeroides TaxID=1063 RepID=UPI000E5BA887|nr:hypothetical protein [Cereibacter sphaeroides]RIA00028.1 hypothetical protein D1122_04575 [Cereibacter sphaeroides]